MGRPDEEAVVDCVVADGGATRCRLAAFDATGRRLAEAMVDSPASLTSGESSAWASLRGGIRLLGKALGKPDPAWMPTLLVFGLAGSLQDERRARFLALVAQDAGPATRCRLVTDGHAQLLGASGGRPGICLAVGTGSVVHWLDADGTSGMAGGWGFPVGDEASGAWLGARLLQHYVWYRDGEAQGSPLMGLLDERTGANVSAIQRLTTESRSTVQAALAPLVIEAAALGDVLASSLLDEGVDWCVRLIARAPAGLPVHLVGGLADAYAPRLAARLDARLAPPRGDALNGLFMLAGDRDA